jgi:hypothetical protein
MPQTTTITKAAQLLGVNRSTLRYHLRRRGVETFKFGNYSLLSLEAAKAAIQKPQEQERIYFETLPY